MNGMEKIIDFIRSESEAELREIAKKAGEECERIRAVYAAAEQDEYWNAIDAGTKETERRLERLNKLAEMEANKQILATQQEMINEAFALAAKKLKGLPKSDFEALLVKLGLGTECGADEIVSKYRSSLSNKVTSVLFN